MSLLQHMHISRVAVLLALTELAKPVERPCLCCNTRTSAPQVSHRTLSHERSHDIISHLGPCSLVPPHQPLQHVNQNLFHLACEHAAGAVLLANALEFLGFV